MNADDEKQSDLLNRISKERREIAFMRGLLAAVKAAKGAEDVEECIARILLIAVPEDV